MGFCASLVSDTISNSLRVVKTYRQVNETRISYSASLPVYFLYSLLSDKVSFAKTAAAAKAVIATDGVFGFFTRGLGTRIITNGLQSIMFSILWKLFLDL